MPLFRSGDNAASRSGPMWDQFRRLLLGIVIECLLEQGVQLDFRSIRIEFDEDSEFRVPRLDNFMRFKGSLSATLHEPLPPDTVRRLAEALKQTWPSLLGVLDIPIGDRLTPEKSLVEVTAADQRLVVSFDLVAD